MTRGDRTFLDTNVLLEATDTKRALHRIAHAVVASWPEAGVDLFISGQVVREYLVVATRPVEQNGLGLSSADALENVRRIRSRVALCPENDAVCSLLQRLAGNLQIVGKRFHDLNLMATAISAGLKSLITANPTDFPPGLGLEVVPLAEATLATPP